MADIGLTIGFEIEQGDLDAAFAQQVESLGASFDSAQSSIQAMQGSLRDLIQPMTQLRDLAKEMAESFEAAKDAASSIRGSIASTRLHTGAGGAAGGGGGGSAISSMLGGGALSSLLSVVGPLLLGAAGGGAIAGGISTFAGAGIQALTGSGSISDRMSGFGRAVMGDDAPAGPKRPGFMTPIQQFAQGQTAAQILNQPGAPRNVAGAYGMLRGLAGSMGQGPVAMISQTIGGAYGAAQGQEVGANLARRMGVDPTAGRIAGAEIGRQALGGTMQRYITEGMQRYPGFLATSASMAQPGMYGADVRRLRGLGAARFGYGPEQIGSEFSGLYQGYGGGALTRDTEMTSMAYSRAYGVSMGAQGQAIGGLMNIGGGGQMATPEQREDTMLRVMTDAISAGFGRRLPEFAQSVSAGVGVAMSGPGMVGQSAMQNLIADMSQATANVARTRGVGLQQAGRVTGAFAGAPGGLLRGLVQGGGDPRTMGLMVGANRGRFANLFDMAVGREVAGGGGEREGGLLQAQEDPFGAGIEFLAPMMQQVIASSSTQMGALTSISSLFSGMGQDLPVDAASDIVLRGGAAQQRARAEGRDVSTEEMVEILQGISGTIEGEGPSLEETMRDIQSSGETIMREQLTAMQTSASFAALEHSISASMSTVAGNFYRAQQAETLNMSRYLQTSSMAQSVMAANDIRRAAAEENLGRGDIEGWIERLAGGFIEQAQSMGTEFAPVRPPPGEDPGLAVRTVRGLRRNVRRVLSTREQRRADQDARDAATFNTDLETQGITPTVVPEWMPGDPPPVTPAPVPEYTNNPIPGVPYPIPPDPRQSSAVGVMIATNPLSRS
jgi:hypothetical protein